MSNSNKISRAPVLWQALVAAIPIKFDLTPTSPELFRAVARIGAIVFATGFWGMGAFAGWDLTIRHAAIFSGFASLLSLFCTAMILFWVIKPSEKAIQGALLSAENRSERLANALARLELQKKVLDFHAVVSECDATGRITYVNDAFCRVSGYAPGDLIGKPYSMFNAEGLVKTDWDEMYRKVTSGGVWQQEVCNKRKDGSDFWLLQTVIGAMNAGGELTSYVNVGTDLSESKALRQEMLRKDKLAQLGELTATVAHEIRNPLGAVKTAAFVLERKVNSYVQQQTRLQALAETGGNVVGAPGSTLDVANQFQRISTGISRCDRIIAELLDFARKKAVNAKEHSIDLWVREVVDDGVTANAIKSNSVTEKKLGTDAVTTAKIKDGDVQTADLAPEAVDDTKLAKDSVTLRTLKPSLPSICKCIRKTRRNCRRMLRDPSIRRKSKNRIRFIPN